MCVFKYEIINPITNYKKPYIDSKGWLIVPAIGKKYKYYIEVARYNPNKCYREYFILLSFTAFSSQCRRCRVDDYGRLKLVPKGEIKDIFTEQMKDYGNVTFEYVESEDDYDVFSIN